MSRNMFGASCARAAMLVAATTVSLIVGGCGGAEHPQPVKSGAVSAALAPGGATIGLVLSGFDYKFHRNGDGRDECPEGFTPTNRDNWESQFPTSSERQRHLARCESIKNRGPHCENVWNVPQVIGDALPFREVRGKFSYGADLDGVAAGVDTEATCAHENFVSAEGETGIDNQYYRFLGCEKGLDHFTPLEFRKRVVEGNLVYRILLQIGEVDDEREDSAVVVTLHRGRDPLILDAAGHAVPWQSQRIDPDIPEKFIYRLRGRISDGVLVTDPADVMWEDIAWERRLLIRGMQLRLTLTPEGAQGMRTGYIESEQLWKSYARFAESWGKIVGASPPSAYAALHRLADGYKNPATGACTALSSARQLEFVRAYLMHPDGENS